MAIQSAQPFPRVLDAVAGGTGNRGIDAGSVVGNRQLELVAIAPLPCDTACPHLHAPGIRSLRDPVPDRVFDQMLQDEARHRRRQHALVDVKHGTQTIREARLLDRQVLAHEIELLRQRDFWRAMTGQGPAQHVSHRVHQRAQAFRGQLERDEEEGRSAIAALEGGILGGTARERTPNVGLALERREQGVSHQVRSGSIEGIRRRHCHREQLGDGPGKPCGDEAVGPARFARQGAPSPPGQERGGAAREWAGRHADHGPGGDDDPGDQDGTTREASYDAVSSGGSIARRRYRQSCSITSL